nr:MAG TPA: hypothetical protein [Caudoviricetes sp.]
MTKENYEDAIMRMYNFCISSDHTAQIREQFSQDLDFLAKLVEENFEEKQAIKSETNFEHYFEYLSKIKMMDFALINGRIKDCSVTQCYECDFNHDCIEEKFKWLKQPYQKKTYKLTQFEYDLIKMFDRCKECCLLNEIECLKKLIEKGYFKGIDPFTKVHDIIDNCEVIK